MLVRNIFLLFFICVKAFAAPITVAQVSDLNFGVAYHNDPAKTVPPGTFENAENASFRITGDPNRAFSIQLPRKTDMKHVTANSKIRVQSFTSFPNSSGALDSTGNADLYVGASRDRIRNGLPSGSYVGVFTVTVIY